MDSELDKIIHASMGSDFRRVATLEQEDRMAEEVMNLPAFLCWAPEDDAAIDRLMLRIDNDTLTRTDWDAIEDEIATTRQAALATAEADIAALRGEVERLREALERLSEKNLPLTAYGIIEAALDGARDE